MGELTTCTFCIISITLKQNSGIHLIFELKTSLAALQRVPTCQMPGPDFKTETENRFCVGSEKKCRVFCQPSTPGKNRDGSRSTMIKNGAVHIWRSFPLVGCRIRILIGCRNRILIGCWRFCSRTRLIIGCRPRSKLVLFLSTLHKATVHDGRRQSSRHDVLLFKTKTTKDSQGKKILGAPNPEGRI